MGEGGCSFQVLGGGTIEVSHGFQRVLGRFSINLGTVGFGCFFPALSKPVVVE